MMKNINYYQESLSHFMHRNFRLKALVFFLFLSNSTIAQPKVQIEFQVNTCKGFVIDELSNKPIYGIKVDILSGSKEIKGSAYTDKEGKYFIDLVGYLWRPRIKFTSYDYGEKIILLNNSHINDTNNVNIDVAMSKIPDDKKPKIFKKGTISSRAKTFFWKDNIFYQLDRNSVPGSYKASRIIINQVSASQNTNGELELSINGNKINPLLCYVPQNGKYENILSILSGYMDNKVFDKSNLPKFLDEHLLEPTLVFGKIIDAITKEPITGAEVKILGISDNRRVTGIDGRFAFQIPEPGEYFLDVVPPFKSEYDSPPKKTLSINNGRGGWHKSDQILFPKDRFHWAK